MRQILGRITMVVCVLCVAAGLIYGGYVYYGYARGRLEYASLQNEYTRPFEEKAPDKQPAASQKEEMQDETEDGLMSGKTIWKPLAAPMPEDAPERLSVDFEELKKKNEDVVAWIHVPAVSISYPVLQGDDNEYYLHRDINGGYLYAGSVFMDAFNNPGFYNYNTIIYGHNMRDGSMFAGIKGFQDQEVYRSCPYFWIYTPQADLLYEVCSVHSASPGSQTFMLRFSDYEAYRRWQEEMLSLSVFPTGSELTSQDRIVTLSTCTQSSAVRMTIQGKLIWKEERK